MALISGVWLGFRALAGVPAPRIVVAAWAVFTAVLVDAFFIEPRWLAVTRLRLKDERLRRPLRIILVADLQADRFGAYERAVFRTVMRERPDLVILSGDYLQTSTPGEWSRLRDRFRRELKRLRFSAPLGVCAVRGNVDPPRWRELFAGLGVRTFERTGTVKLNGLWVTGLSVADSFAGRAPVPRTRGPHLVVGHSPNFALGTRRGDLLLAGHTHGGQVRLPLIGPLLTVSRVPRAWAAGVTRLGRNRRLVVSRGVGMERLAAPRVRFLCRPELVVIELGGGS